MLNWTLIEYSYFICLFEIVSRFAFRILKPLHRYLLDGRFNKYLVRPVNVFIQHNFEEIYFYELIDIILNLILLGILLFIDNNLNFLNFYFILFLFLTMLGQFLFWILFESISFIAIGIKNAIDIQLFEINGILKTFPTQFFLNSNLKFLLIFPNAFVSLTLVEILKGSLVKSIYLVYLLIIIFVLILLIYINWKIGLKKYEAFG